MVHADQRPRMPTHERDQPRRFSRTVIRKRPRHPGRRLGAGVPSSGARAVSTRRPGPFLRQQGLLPKSLPTRILAVEGIDGVTFSGGEPFAQAEALASVGELVQEAGLSIVTFTGYTYEQLTAGTGSCMEPSPRQPRISSLPARMSTPWPAATPYIGSSNQQVIPLTGRIRSGSPPEEAPGEILEFSIAADGILTATGFPKGTLLRQIAARCRGE